MSEDDLRRYFTLARNVSKHSDYRTQMGAVLLKKSTPISVGFNKTKYHPKLCDGLSTMIHAEVSALVSSGKDYIHNSTMIIYREYADGTPALARPCKHCMNRLKNFGVRNIVYSIKEFPYWRMESI